MSLPPTRFRRLPRPLFVVRGRSPSPSHLIPHLAACASIRRLASPLFVWFLLHRQRLGNRKKPTDDCVNSAEYLLCSKKRGGAHGETLATWSRAVSGISIVFVWSANAENVKYPAANNNMSLNQAWRSSEFCLQNHSDSCPMNYTLNSWGWLNVSHAYEAKMEYLQMFMSIQLPYKVMTALVSNKEILCL